MNNPSFTDVLLSGAKNAYEEIMNFRSVMHSCYEDEVLRPEYLLTVNVAQELNREHSTNTVTLEQRVLPVARCLTGGSLGYGGADRIIDALNSKGKLFGKKSRLDICLFHEDLDSEPKAIIEVKLATRSFGGIREDLERLLRLSRVKDSRHTFDTTYYEVFAIQVDEEKADLTTLINKLDQDLSDWNAKRYASAQLLAPHEYQVIVPLETILEVYEDGYQERIQVSNGVTFQPCVITVASN